ncbi:MAG: hypothetical protein DHS20C02_01130 [Micavibrio sp.]|nr:MAG: hypothetical protein DHS20C02_01130 [Micavibrio sp.]
MASSASTLASEQNVQTETNFQQAFRVSVAPGAHQKKHVKFIENYIRSKKKWMPIEIADCKKDGSKWAIFGCRPEETNDLKGMGYNLKRAPFFDDFCC